ncbi:hypothetical protein TRFO_13835 [Tritrichomonas foetus]|uniref:Uncharacterized protein n=1 Tax=Tritrichomonas foetus TaxID=1144522 RepID=A0A1J4L1H2_9EUKA|nr:hypothetical protein TRFO_13835 [Tritrichomonas foetus]|eukprot:OHT15812.1 hypothetical protein TRFO_13835 [Tritrichomonas foetus]
MLGNLVKKIATAPGGANICGYNTITSNSKYFAYASRYSVFIYFIENCELSETICQGGAKISNIRLSHTSVNEIAILYVNGHVIVYDIVQKETLSQGQFPNKEGMRYLTMEYSPNGRIITVYTDHHFDFYRFDINQKKVNSYACPSSSNVIFFKQHPELPNLTLIALENSNIVAFNTEKIVIHYRSFSDKLYHLSFDPLNTMNCLLIGKNPTWAVFSFLPDFNLISKCTNNTVKAKSGDWVPDLPGHIVTGSSDHGILHLWTISNSQIVDTIQLEDVPVVSVKTITDKIIIVTFGDGLFGVVDVTKRSYLYRINNAHRNTVFSCNILPTDPSILATGGADGQICLWSLPNLERKNRFTICNTGTLFTTCFSPGGGYLAAGSIKGAVMLFSMKTFEMLFSQNLHKKPCLSIAWSPHDPDIICTAGEDNNCHIFNIKERKIITTITVKAKFRKVQWSRKEKTIAVACCDGSIYVRMDGGAYLILAGSSKAPLFDVAWSPFVSTWIAASDDDGGIVLFDTETQTCKRAVEHVGRARPVLWSETVDYLLISGGYDGKIILWDARSLSKIGVIQAHSSHVYGLATHPQRPYLIVSSSRDETIRVWSLDRMFPQEKVKSLLKEEKFKAEQFCPFDGANDLIKLIHRVLHDGTRQSFNDGDLCHINDIIRLTKKRIARMTSALPHEQATLMRAKKARKTAISAADLCLKSGDIKRYCELMFIAGEFDLALSAAPAVGYNFWQNLMIARAAMLKGSEDSAELTLIAGKPRDAIHQFLELHRFDNAMLITAALRETTFLPRTKSVSIKPNPEQSKDLPFMRTDFESASDYGPYIVASKRSIRFAKEGKPLLAAAALLTVGDVSGAAWRLLHCGELMWSVEVARCLEEMDERIYDVLARYCIVNGCADDIFPLLSAKLRRKLAPLVPLADDSARDEFYTKFQMKTSFDYYEEAKRARGAAKVQFLLLCGRQNEAAMLAVQILRAMMAPGPYDYSDAMNVIQLIRNIYVSPEDNKEPIWKEVIALCFYFSVYEAMWRGYDSIIERLVASTEELISENNFEYMKPRIKEMKIAAALALARFNSSFGKAYVEANKNIGACETFDGINKLNDNFTIDGGSTVHVLGTGNLPIDLAAPPVMSVCSGLRIDGNIFYLEDGQSAMSQEEAMMWFEVNPFSPLKTHQRLFPY